MRVLGNSQIRITIIVLFAFFALPSYAKYAGGTGEPNNPYLIYTVEHLNNIGSESNDCDKHFKLMSNIDLSGITYSDAVIPNFAGLFDGNGFIISNLTITGQSNLGLFGKVDSTAEISNLSIKDVNIVGLGNYVGGLAGENNGNISYCCSTGIVNGIEYIGGLVGRNTQSGSIMSSHTSCNVNGNFHVGGLVGSNSGIVINCYSNGPVNGTGDIGGLAGFESLQSDDLSEDNIPGNVIDSFWDIETSGCITSDGGIGKTTAEMMDPNTYKNSGWDFMDETTNGTDDSWWIDQGQDYPRLYWETTEDINNDGNYYEKILYVENSEPIAQLASDGSSTGTQYFTEQFFSGSDPFDLTYKSVTFTPTTNGSSYNAVISEISQFPTDPAGGTYLDLGDDGYVLVNLINQTDPNNQKRVYIYGFGYIRLYVGSNGYITFTRGDTYNSDTLYNHFSTKRISCLFQDLDPSWGGIISKKQLSDRIAITWENVPEYASGNSNTFQIELYFDGKIKLSWLGIDSKDGIVGLSKGGGLPDDFEDTDFSDLTESSSPGNVPETPSGRRDRRK